MAGAGAGLAAVRGAYGLGAGAVAGLAGGVPIHVQLPRIGPRSFASRRALPRSTVAKP